VDVTDEAWVRLPNDEEMRAMGYGARPHPYDFGFIPAMARLRSAHKRITPKMADLFRVVGLFNYFTRLADGAGLRLDPQVEEAGRTETAMRRP
jgi:hypothetical protein